VRIKTVVIIPEQTGHQVDCKKRIAKAMITKLAIYSNTLACLDAKQNFAENLFFKL
jgi:hypothetical protein